jgi:hypothetical protein
MAEEPKVEEAAKLLVVPMTVFPRTGTSLTVEPSIIEVEEATLEPRVVVGRVECELDKVGAKILELPVAVLVLAA